MESGPPPPDPEPVTESVPVEPTEEDKERHRLTHLPFQAWCPECVQGAGRGGMHRRKPDTGDKGQEAVVQMDCTFYSRGAQQRQAPEDESILVTVLTQGGRAASRFLRKGGRVRELCPGHRGAVPEHLGAFAGDPADRQRGLPQKRCHRHPYPHRSSKTQGAGIAALLPPNPRRGGRGAQPPSGAGAHLAYGPPEPVPQLWGGCESHGVPVARQVRSLVRSTLSGEDHGQDDPLQDRQFFFFVQGVASNSYAHQTSAVLSETFFWRSCKKRLP